jgi:hypothetical protein
VEVEFGSTVVGEVYTATQRAAGVDQVGTRGGEPGAP